MYPNVMVVQLNVIYKYFGFSSAVQHTPAVDKPTHAQQQNDCNKIVGNNPCAMDNESVEYELSKGVASPQLCPKRFPAIPEKEKEKEIDKVEEPYQLISNRFTKECAKTKPITNQQKYSVMQHYQRDRLGAWGNADESEVPGSLSGLTRFQSPKYNKVRII